MGQIIDFIVGGLAAVIKAFATVGFGNIAFGIILFTIAIRLCLLPLTLKAVRSSRAMQQLQPLIKEINEKYKTKPGERLAPDKAQKKQAEIMALYSEYSVNPAAGCLPMLIQIPIFFAVYAAVTRSIGDPALRLVQNAWNFAAPGAVKEAPLTDQGFLWLNTITRPDPTFILPVLMVLFQFTTQRMTIPKGGGADDNQRRINGIMQWMPLIFGFTALNFPAGPVIYWVTTSIFSTVQQYFITGWGSLGDIPGLSFLKARELPKIELKKRDPATAKPAKPGLMQRLMENQEKLSAENARKGGATVGAGAADASGDKIIEGTVVTDGDSNQRRDFGRKVGVTSETLRTSGTFRKSDGREPVRSETRALNQEESIRQAYQNLNRRPPKKGSSGPAAGSSGASTSSDSSGVSRSKKK